MPDPIADFLPGVPADRLLDRLRRSPGKELDAKFHSPDSSAALAANSFGWFMDRPGDLPPLPGVPMGRADEVLPEEEIRFPWSGGRHPWLDVVVTTPTTLVGIESKRYEPFRPGKATAFSEAFNREWGPEMARFTRMRRDLAEGARAFQTLDAGQLVKHACGLRTQGLKRGRGAVLVYLYAEPQRWASSDKPVDPARIALHRAEVAAFADAVRGDAVTFVAVRWADVLAQWAGVRALAAHAAAVTARFGGLG